MKGISNLASVAASVIKKHSGAFFMSSLLLLFGALCTKQYSKKGAITFRHWHYSDGGLVIQGWQAIVVIVFFLAIGSYGLLLIIKKIKIELSRNQSLST